MSVRPWKKLDSRIVREGYATVRSARYELPDGTVKDFDVVSFSSDAVSIVLPITPDGQIITVPEFGWASERVMQDLPGGGVEPGEPALEAAKRELLEETGYASEDWVALGATPIIAPSPLVQHFFLARGCTKVADQNLDSSEFIEVELLDRETFERVVERGMCHDAQAWFRALARGLV